MNIKQRDGSTGPMLSIEGRLDAVTAPAAETAFNCIIGVHTRTLILNLSLRDYIRSAGLRVLLVTAKKLARQNGRLILRALQAPIQDIFEISGLLEPSRLLPQKRRRKRWRKGKVAMRPLFRGFFLPIEQVLTNGVV